MQQNQPERRFSNTAQQPVYRFPQNQAAYGSQPQQNFHGNDTPEGPALSIKEQRALKKAHKRARKRKFSLIWHLLALYGLITLLVQAARYVVIPLLVYLNVLAGGAL